MADTYTSSLRVAQQTIGGNENAWGTILNASLAALDQGIAGIVSISVTAGNVTLTTANNADDQSRNALLIFTGTPGATRTVTMPDVEKLTWVYNNTSDGSSITFTAGAGTTVTVLSGEKQLIYTDGATNAAALSPQYKTGTFTPTIGFGGASVGITYTQQVGEYTKIGDRVFYTINIVLSSKGSSVGAATIRNLPFAAAGGSERIPVVPELVNIDTAGGYLGIRGAHTSTNLALREYGDNVSTVAIDDTDFQNTSGLAIVGHYRI